MSSQRELLPLRFTTRSYRSARITRRICLLRVRIAGQASQLRETKRAVSQRLTKRVSAVSEKAEHVQSLKFSNRLHVPQSAVLS